MYPDDDHQVNMNERDIDKFLDESPDADKYEIRYNKFTGEVKVKNKPITLSYGESDMDKYLNNKESADLLYFYSLKLPSCYKDKSLEEIQEALEKSTEILSSYKRCNEKCCKL